MAGETVYEVVLAAVGLIGDDHDVAPLGQGGEGIAPLLGEELLDGGEDHASGGHRQLLPKVGPALGLRRRLAQQVLAAGEGSEELVVQVVAVGENDDGRVLHSRLADDGAGVEGHGQALAGPLGVPDHSDAPVSGVSAGFPARLVTALFLNRPVCPLQLCSPQGFSDGSLDGMELVIATHLLDQRATAVVIEHDEVPDQHQESFRLADAFQQHLKIGRVRIGHGVTGYGAPGLEPLLAGGEGPDAGGKAVGDDESFVH